MLEILRGAECRAAIGALPGYNGERAGVEEGISAAFPEWPAETRG